MVESLLALPPVSADPVRAGDTVLALAPMGEAVSLGAFAGAGRAALLARVRETFGVDLPEQPRAVASADGQVTFVWCGPTQWLALSLGESGAEGGLLARLRAACGDLCALTSQSDSRTTLRLSGPQAREVAGRLVPVDLHDAVFEPGHVALTLAGHIPVLIRQVARNPVTYEFLVFRSFAESLFHDLHVAMNGALS
ncbi:sarcosine oxidase subunit gamma [Acetobacter suratthaniensis]|uniref:Sarcosine oxidase subunit gamma n=1 Tax=Acetobacter suratthaniensis TaxID=1502841 RepID=A0ABS3LM70_9PROT|nr:sarcosine oxidase subunit gamma family protein [Acetobacter suratthaniensis]MBO1328461.1 sarcosine oxidase subunit gamma [Acetobacter suratthaniensis]MCX2566590.1 sarcosine oxidase subunit gamma [Acetobacter suratthaniensis]